MLCTTALRLTSSRALVLRAHMKGTLVVVQVAATTFSGSIIQGAASCSYATQDAATTGFDQSEAHPLTIVQLSGLYVQLYASSSHASEDAITELSIQDEVVATTAHTSH